MQLQWHTITYLWLNDFMCMCCAPLWAILLCELLCTEHSCDSLLTFGHSAQLSHVQGLSTRLSHERSCGQRHGQEVQQERWTGTCTHVHCFASLQVHCISTAYNMYEHIYMFVYFFIYCICLHIYCIYIYVYMNVYIYIMYLYYIYTVFNCMYLSQSTLMDWMRQCG